MSKTLFSQISDRELPSTIEYEDAEFMAIRDIRPRAPIHVLVFPKKPYPTLEDVHTEDDQFHCKLLSIVRLVAKQLGIQENYKIVMNVGLGVQQVPHLHVHLMGGWKNPSPEVKTGD